MTFDFLQVEAGATRSLTQDEINQLKSTGALSEYNTVEGASASAESSSSGSESDHDQSSVETKVRNLFASRKCTKQQFF